MLEVEYFGIDLGTTNSCIAAITNGKPTIIEIDGEKTVPSVLANKNGDWIVGQSARNFQQIQPENCVSSVKRKMDDLTFKVHLGGTEMTPLEVSAKILGYVAKQASQKVGHEVKQVVITVPAWFKEVQRQTTLEAGRLAGLEVLQVINEPTAAAIAHDVKHLDEGKDENWIVFDLGGGTFDVSVLNVTSSTHEVLASVGNTFLGGDDFDKRLFDSFCRTIKDEFVVDPSESPIAAAKLRLIAEKAKISLSSETFVEISESLLVGEKAIHFKHKLTRSDFENLISDLILATMDKVQEALEEADLKVDDVHRMLLVGGSTRIPAIADALKERYGLDAETWVDPDLSVAMGAAIQSAVRSGASIDREVIEIAPHSLGIAALGAEDHIDGEELDHTQHPKTFATLIRRNSRLPSRSVKTFSKMFPEQERVDIVVYQGESSNTRNNTFLGECRIPLERANSPRLDVEFSYDKDGIVAITVREDDHDKGKSFKLNIASQGQVVDQSFELVDLEEIAPAEDLKIPDATNYLVEKIASHLQEIPDTNIEKKLAEYKVLLAEGDDAKMDDLEEELYEWLDGKEED